jgi:hypothetical protein
MERARQTEMTSLFSELPTRLARLGEPVSFRPTNMEPFGLSEYLKVIGEPEANTSISAEIIKFQTSLCR